MKKVIWLTGFCLAHAAGFALPDYEPFADSTGAGGTSYTTGANLIGQVNASGRTWFQAGPATAIQPTIAAGDLTISGLASSGGGQSAAFGGNGTSARLNLSVGAGGILSGTVYYSFAMRLTDLTGLNSSGVFWAGFNNTQGSQTTTPNTVVTRVVTRSTTAGVFNVGLDKSSATASSFVWAAGDYTTSDTIFLVGSYTFNPNTDDDVSQLWINPDSSTFAAGSAPAGSISSVTGGDIARVASFVLYDRSANEPAAGQIDDLRFGLSWADVTPVPEPASLSLGALGLAYLAWRLRRKSSGSGPI
jgi:hypothetical protein